MDAEAAAVLAVGQFRRAAIGQLLYAADDLSGSAWSDRGWRDADAARRTLFMLAAASALRLAQN